MTSSISIVAAEYNFFCEWGYWSKSSILHSVFLHQKLDTSKLRPMSDWFVLRGYSDNFPDCRIFCDNSLQRSCLAAHCGSLLYNTTRYRIDSIFLYIKCQPTNVKRWGEPILDYYKRAREVFYSIRSREPIVAAVINYELETRGDRGIRESSEAGLLRWKHTEYRFQFEMGGLPKVPYMKELRR